MTQKFNSFACNFASAFIERSKFKNNCDFTNFEKLVRIEAFKLDDTIHTSLKLCYLSPSKKITAHLSTV